MGYELHIGPYRGRDPHLWRASTGIVANGMELFEASRIPFATIADYLRDPEGYDPEASWQRAMRDVVGEADLDAFALFADNVRSSCLSADDAPIVGRGAGVGAVPGRAGRRRRAPRPTSAPSPTGCSAAADAPAARTGREPRAHRRGADPGSRRSSSAPRPSRGSPTSPPRVGSTPTDRASCARILLRLRRARVRVFGDVLEMTLSVLSGTMLRPGEVP